MSRNGLDPGGLQCAFDIGQSGENGPQFFGQIGEFVEMNPVVAEAFAGTDEAAWRIEPGVFGLSLKGASHFQVQDRFVGAGLADHRDPALQCSSLADHPSDDLVLFGVAHGDKDTTPSRGEVQR